MGGWGRCGRAAHASMQRHRRYGAVRHRGDGLGPLPMPLPRLPAVSARQRDVGGGCSHRRLRLGARGRERPCLEKPDAERGANSCAVCGAALPGRDDPAHNFVPAGLRPSDIEGVGIRHHIFTGSKARWDVIRVEGRQHDRACGEGCLAAGRRRSARRPERREGPLGGVSRHRAVLREFHAAPQKTPLTFCGAAFISCHTG